jgi:hypothetical protein
MDSEGGAKWDDLLKQSEEKNYADEQLANRNDVQSRWVLLRVLVLTLVLG